VDTTTTVLLLDSLGALGVVHKQKKRAVPLTIAIIIDLARCKNDNDVLIVMAHQMSHAHCYVKWGRTDVHGKDWEKLATIYAQALGIEEIAHPKPAPCFQVLDRL
jgi:hypothetical protein